MSEDQQPQQTEHVVSEDAKGRTINTAPATSFIYPVRSLLTGIQGAAENASSTSSPEPPTVIKTHIRPAKTQFQSGVGTSPGPGQSLGALEDTLDTGIGHRAGDGKSSNHVGDYVFQCLSTSSACRRQ